MWRVAGTNINMLAVGYRLRRWHAQLTHEQRAIIVWRQREAIAKRAYCQHMYFLITNEIDLRGICFPKALVIVSLAN